MNGIENESYGGRAGKIVRNVLDNLQNRGVSESTIHPELSNLRTIQPEAKEVIPLSNEEILQVKLDNLAIKLAETEAALDQTTAEAKILALGLDAKKQASSTFVTSKNKVFIGAVIVFLSGVAGTQFINNQVVEVKPLLKPGKEFLTDNNTIVIDEFGRPRLIKVGPENHEKSNSQVESPKTESAE